MKYLASILILVATQLLTGCFQTAVGLRVKTDGSGTVSKVFSMTTEGLKEAKGMQEGFGGGGANKLPTEINEAALKADAAKLGEGVTFVSAKKLEVAGREGYVATYAFKDVTKLKLSLDTAMNDQAGGAGAMKMKGGSDEPMTFSFTKGNPAELVINTPLKKAAAGDVKNSDKKPKEKSPVADEQMMAMMAPMLKDMRMTLVIDVEGTIVKTNAVNCVGSRITMMDVEMGKVFADPTVLKNMDKISDPTTPEAKELIKKIPGVKMEFENPVRVSFK